MTPRLRFPYSFFFVLGVALSSPGHAQQPTLDSSGTNAPATSSASQPAADPFDATMKEAIQLLNGGQTDAALEKVNGIIQTNPKYLNAHLLLGNIYARKQLWAQAGKEYETALALDGTNATAKFNLAETKFRVKDYDGARLIFVALENDPDNGDLAAYKVFLCNLFGGHEDAAAKELDVFNQVESHASYYFANAAWDLFHNKPEDARGWLNSATNIYTPNKVLIYSISLKDLGYLPLPPPPPPSN